MATWEKEKKKATRLNKKKKKKKKRRCQIFLGVWGGSGAACQPPGGETKPKQSVSASVGVHVCFLRACVSVCVCVCVCVCSKLLTGKMWVSSRAHKAMKACDDRVWWTHSITHVGTHAHTHSHTHTHTHTHRLKHIHIHKCTLNEGCHSRWSHLNFVTSTCLEYENCLKCVIRSCTQCRCFCTLRLYYCYYNKWGDALHKSCKYPKKKTLHKHVPVQSLIIPKLSSIEAYLLASFVASLIETKK